MASEKLNLLARLCVLPAALLLSIANGYAMVGDEPHSNDKANAAVQPIVFAKGELEKRIALPTEDYSPNITACPGFIFRVTIIPPDPHSNFQARANLIADGKVAPNSVMDVPADHSYSLPTHYFQLQLKGTVPNQLAVIRLYPVLGCRPDEMSTVISMSSSDWSYFIGLAEGFGYDFSLSPPSSCRMRFYADGFEQDFNPEQIPDFEKHGRIFQLLGSVERQSLYVQYNPKIRFDLEKVSRESIVKGVPISREVALKAGVASDYIEVPPGFSFEVGNKNHLALKIQYWSNTISSGWKDYDIDSQEFSYSQPTLFRLGNSPGKDDGVVIVSIQLAPDKQSKSKK